LDSKCPDEEVRFNPLSVPFAGGTHTGPPPIQKHSKWGDQKQPT